MAVENVYYQQAQREVHRLLSMQNREPFSISEGCFDRTHWCWKFTDFPGARFQEGVYSLAHLYMRSYEGNSLFQNSFVLEWIRAGFRFWCKIQYADGSFDEAYPYERSLAATAFTGFYLGEAFLLVQDQLPAEEKSVIIATLNRAGDWLCENDEYHGVLSNHLGAAAGALCAIHRASGDSKYEARMQHFLERIFRQQSKEGWYEEYGGADPGYQTHATFYLARIWQVTKNEKLLASLKRSLQFLQFFVHPDGTIGGEYASRNTEFYYPAGLEILAEAVPEAAAIANFLRNTVKTQDVVGLSAMDPYNFFPILNNYLFAAENLSSAPKKIQLPFELEGDQTFSEAGIYIRNDAQIYGIFGVSKGGTIKIFDKMTKSLRFLDSGYFAQSSSGIYSSQSFTKELLAERNGNSFTLVTDFFRTNQKIFNPYSFLGFRIFSLVPGRFPAFSYWLKNLLVKVLVKAKKKGPLRLKRKVEFRDGKILLEDQISFLGGAEVKHLFSYPKFATFHMGSSRYFSQNELSVDPQWATVDNAKRLMLEKTITLKREISL